MKRYGKVVEDVSRLRRVDRKNEVAALRVLLRHWRLGSFDGHQEDALTIMEILISKAQ